MTDKKQDGVDEQAVQEAEDAANANNNVPLAGFEDEGNFEGIQDAQQAERS